MGKLTVRGIEAHRPRAVEYKVIVDRGLPLRIAPDGRKTWLVRYAADGKQIQARLRLPMQLWRGFHVARGRGIRKRPRPSTRSRQRRLPVGARRKRSRCGGSPRTNCRGPARGDPANVSLGLQEATMALPARGRESGGPRRAQTRRSPGLRDGHRDRTLCAEKIRELRDVFSAAMEAA